MKTRIEIAKNLVSYWIPGIAILVIVTNEIYGLEQLFPGIGIVNLLLGRSGAIALWILIGVYYAVYSQTFDPLWPLRKRLWTQNKCFILINDEHDRAEPLIWSKDVLPPAVNIDSE